MVEKNNGKIRKETVELMVSKSQEEYGKKKRFRHKRMEFITKEGVDILKMKELAKIHKMEINLCNSWSPSSLSINSESLLKLLLSVLISIL